MAASGSGTGVENAGESGDGSTIGGMTYLKDEVVGTFIFCVFTGVIEALVVTRCLGYGVETLIKELADIGDCFVGGGVSWQWQGLINVANGLPAQHTHSARDDGVGCVLLQVSPLDLP